VFKVIVVGLVCVGGAGAIAAANFKSAAVLRHPITYPVVAGNKADRLSLVSAQDVQPTVGKAELAFAPPSEPAVSAQPQPKELAKAKAPDFIPRHWHDPNDARASAAKSKPQRSRSTAHNDLSTPKVAESQDCRTDGFGSLMRRLSLQPTCGRWPLCFKALPALPGLFSKVNSCDLHPSPRSQTQSRSTRSSRLKAVTLLRRQHPVRRSTGGARLCRMRMAAR